jgi:Tol biopolymer transport system component
MDDLQRRFHRLDRVVTPDLWGEAVARSVEAGVAPRRTFTPGMALIATALLLAALAGTIAVGGWLNQPSPVREIVTYENGMIVASEGCGQIIGIDPTSFAVREIGRGSDCEAGPWAHSPVWSSDGSRLAYVVSTFGEESDASSIWVYEAATGEARLLESCPDQSCSSVDISPDGSLVAFLANGFDGHSALIVLGVDSGETQRIELSAQRRAPQFSPDGTDIALALLGGRSGIHLVDIRGFEDGHIGEPTLLTGIIDADEVAWSPDGEWIAYMQSGGLGTELEPFNGQGGLSGTGIVVSRADGSETRILATGSATNGPMFPTWSADSSSVAYVTTRSQGDGSDRWRLELWTVAIDGGDPTRIYASAWGKQGFAVPEWSPDGEWIAFGVDLPGDPSATGTFLVRPDGSGLRRASEEMLDVAWQPIPTD